MLLYLRLYYIWCRFLHLGLLSHNDCPLKFFVQIERADYVSLILTAWNAGTIATLTPDHLIMHLT